jgi:hypothetical protein
MSGRRTDSPAVARDQAHLMQLVIYGGSVLGQAQNSPKWVPLHSLDPPLASPCPIPGSVSRTIRGWVIPGRTLPLSSCWLVDPRGSGNFSPTTGYINVLDNLSLDTLWVTNFEIQWSFICMSNTISHNLVASRNVVNNHYTGLIPSQHKKINNLHWVISILDMQLIESYILD